MRLGPLALCLCLWAGTARADDYDELGRLEKQSVDAVMKERGLTLERVPEGKVLGRILVNNQAVFSHADGWFLRWFNHFHWTSHEKVVAREVLLRPGEPWSQALVNETQRNLKNPVWSNVVVLLPVQSAVPGKVDLLVVTRDVWSLRFNTTFEVQQGVLTALSTSLTENNLFGTRKRFAFVLDMDQGEIALGPTYVDPNIHGTHLTLTTGVRALFARSSQAFEGTASATTLSYPLLSIRQHWGADLAASHVDAVDCFFRGNSLRVYDDPDTPAVEALPREYHRRSVSTVADVVRSFGSEVVQRVTFGHQLDITRPSFLGNFPTDPTLRAAFARDVFPRSERASSLFVKYTVFTPDYAAYRDLDTFDLREDFQLGPNVEAKVSGASSLIGSERDFVGLGLKARWVKGFGGGLERAAASWSGRLDGGRLIDNLVSGELYAATPMIHCTFRVVGQAAVDVLVHETNNRFEALGGDTGMRGYAINAFTGLGRAVSHLELRGAPWAWLFFRANAILFWDVGGAADSWSALRLRHDVGVGVRWLIPQLDPFVFRFDWAVPLDGAGKGLPGRFTLGVLQVF